MTANVELTLNPTIALADAGAASPTTTASVSSMENGYYRAKPTPGPRLAAVGCGVLALVSAAAVGGVFVGRATKDDGKGSGSMPPVARAPLPAGDAVLTRIAWGSCAKQQYPQPYWDAVHAYGTELAILLGDNVYGDCRTDGCPELKEAYDALEAHPSYRGAKASLPMLITWDDHDYGLNDGGAANPYRDYAKELFLEFVEAPPDDPRRSRDGVYSAQSFGPAGRRVQVILLDTRFFRADFAETDERYAPGKERYVPRDDGDMLGEEQWRWLGNLLREPADLRLLASSIQVVADGHGWEWCGPGVDFATPSATRPSAQLAHAAPRARPPVRRVGSTRRRRSRDVVRGSTRGWPLSRAGEGHRRRDGVTRAASPPAPAAAHRSDAPQVVVDAHERVRRRRGLGDARRPARRGGRALLRRSRSEPAASLRARRRGHRPARSRETPARLHAGEPTRHGDAVVKMARGARNVMHAQVHVNHFGSLDIDWDARRVVVGLRRAEAAQGAAADWDLPEDSTDRAGALLQSTVVEIM